MGQTIIREATETPYTSAHSLSLLLNMYSISPVYPKTFHLILDLSLPFFDHKARQFKGQTGDAVCKKGAGLKPKIHMT